MAHTFTLPLDDHVENEIFADGSSYVGTALDGCDYTYALSDKTGIDASTEGNLYIDSVTGAFELENWSTEKVNLGATIIITNTGSLDNLDADNWADYDSSTGLYQGNVAYSGSSTLSISGFSATTVCGPASTSLTMSLDTTYFTQIPNYSETPIFYGTVTSSNPICPVTDNALTAGDKLYDLSDSLTSFTVDMFESANAQVTSHPFTVTSTAEGGATETISGSANLATVCHSSLEPSF